MILVQSIEDSLKRIIKEQRHIGKILDYGLRPRRKLLLVGPPGTGKTFTASALAGELGIPLFLVRLDALITKYMGETASFVKYSTRCVMCAVSISLMNSMLSALSVGSLTMLVRSEGFLIASCKMIEQDESNSIIIAATNHPEILDYALFRRFDDVIEYGLPSPPQIISVLKNKLTNFLTGLNIGIL